MIRSIRLFASKHFGLHRKMDVWVVRNLQIRFDILCHRSHLCFHRTFKYSSKLDFSQWRTYILSKENGRTNPNWEQQTFNGHFCFPATPYWPQSAFESHFEVQFPEPHSEGENPHSPFVPQHAAMGHGVWALHVPVGRAREFSVEMLVS